MRLGGVAGFPVSDINPWLAPSGERLANSMEASAVQLQSLRLFREEGVFVRLDVSPKAAHWNEGSTLSKSSSFKADVKKTVDLIVKCRPAHEVLVFGRLAAWTLSGLVSILPRKWENSTGLCLVALFSTTLPHTSHSHIHRTCSRVGRVQPLLLDTQTLGTLLPPAGLHAIVASRVLLVPWLVLRCDRGCRTKWSNSRQGSCLLSVLSYCVPWRRRTKR